MERFAEVRAYLRHRREVIPDLDILLGATALRCSVTVLTYNVRHLSRVADLSIYQLRSLPPLGLARRATGLRSSRSSRQEPH